MRRGIQEAEELETRFRFQNRRNYFEKVSPSLMLLYLVGLISHKCISLKFGKSFRLAILLNTCKKLFFHEQILLEITFREAEPKGGDQFFFAGKKMLRITFRL